MYNQENTLDVKNKTMPSAPVFERINRIRDVESQIADQISHLYDRVRSVSGTVGICPGENLPKKPVDNPSCPMEDSLMAVENQLLDFRDSLKAIVENLKI